MATAQNTYTRYDAIGLREFLQDVISDISPMDTPGLSMASEESVNQTLFEWQTDALAAAVTNNQEVEGTEFAGTAITATVRVGNYCQITDKHFVVSGTVDVVSKAGRDSEVAYQIPRRAREIRRDQESHMFANVGGDAGGTGTARVSASLGAWVKTNTNIGASGGDPTYTSGVPGAARTDGTTRAPTTTMFDDVMSQMWTSGADVDGATVICGPVNKKNISAFTNIATPQLTVNTREPTEIVRAADVYVGDFGAVSIVANRFSRERDIWFLNAEMLALGVLRPYQMIDLPPSGDNSRHLMLIEYGLKVLNEAGLGLLADATTS